MLAISRRSHGGIVTRHIWHQSESSISWRNGYSGVMAAAIAGMAAARKQQQRGGGGMMT